MFGGIFRIDAGRSGARSGTAVAPSQNAPSGANASVTRAPFQPVSMPPFRINRMARAVLLSGAMVLGAMATPASAFEADLTLTRSDFDGAEGLLEDLQAASLSLAAERDDIDAPQDVLAAARADYTRLVGVLYSSGRYGPVVRIRIDGREAAGIPPLNPPKAISRVDISVDPGPLFRFSRVSIAPLAPETDLPDGFRTDEPAPSGVISDAAGAGVSRWKEVGHAKAEVASQKIVADHRNARLAADIGLAPGPRVTFGNLILQSDSAVRDKRLRTIAQIPSGEVYSPEALDLAAARLRRTGAFRSVVLREADDLGPGNTLDVGLTVVDEKPRRFGFGAEIASTEGITLSSFWLHRNLLGGAERLRLEAEVGGIGSQSGGQSGGKIEGLDYHLRGRFKRPATFNVDTDLTVLAEIEQLDEPLYFSRQVNLEVGLSRIYSEEITAEAAVAYRYADVRDGLGARQFQHLTLPLQVTWDRRDDRLDPTEGTYLQAKLMPYYGIGDSASGGRATADARVYRGFGTDDRVVAAARLQFGSIIGSSIRDTPPDLLFLSGGGGTVRGQPYQSLGVDVAGARTGGRSFLGLSGEVRARVTDKIQAVAFYDAGYIGPDSWIGDGGDWHAGAGLGIRYKTGIGPIRLDVATPVSGPGGDGFQIYVGIGQAF